MNKVIGALPALLLVVTSALPTRAAPLGPSLPSGASDQVIFSGPGSPPNRVDIPKAAGTRCGLSLKDLIGPPQQRRRGHEVEGLPDGLGRLVVRSNALDG